MMVAARQGRELQRYSASTGGRIVVGCIPYRVRDDNGEVEVLVICSRKKGASAGVLFPKGGWELDECSRCASPTSWSAGPRCPAAAGPGSPCRTPWTAARTSGCARRSSGSPTASPTPPCRRLSSIVLLAGRARACSPALRFVPAGLGSTARRCGTSGQCLGILKQSNGDNSTGLPYARHLRTSLADPV
ncbi:unnamed protein product [Triticum turgidum subsp. durum]|uniref:Nudix hydrolase domain-containing protein n=1 Tax=Triticum turgidum subsp. durum TaxID=4567 RepID=A0A9R0Z7K9_TRITD|nr:unnamed protein product [Triticum turgidum subsp. durum]